VATDGPMATTKASYLASPADKLTNGQLFATSIYWLGLTVIFTALNAVVLPERIRHLVPAGSVNLDVGLIVGLGLLVSIVVQPTVGALSDATVTRWGRRKPYIFVGSLLDLAFVTAFAISQPLLAIVATYLLLQFSSNLAQGPFQGFLPDLVPPAQIGTASALVGLMGVFGPAIGTILVAVPLTLTSGTKATDFTLAIIALGVLELGTALITVAAVDDRPAPNPRLGGPVLAIARSAWGRDLLAHRSFVYLVVSRFFILSGIWMLTSEADLYLSYTLQLEPAQRGALLAGAPVLLGITIAISAIGAAWLSDRLGRKPLIFAACGLGAVGSLLIALAGALPIALGGAVLVGLAGGAFLAVDWALLSEIVPKGASGRFMGLSNVATASSGAFSVLSAGVLVFLVTRGVADPALGVRMAFVLAVTYFGLGALLIRPVRPTRLEAPGPYDARSDP
jgi:MFS family permease